MNHPRSDREFQAMKEDEPSHSKFPKIPSSSRHWSNYKNPRIVRVSRTFGGKDRHSKVCTIRGLRDRRIRLSVPTAIQLYDLQDRLGLNQPSKVVDWLLDATKNDIDKLPPLPMLPIHQPIMPSHNSSHFLSPNLGISAMKEGIKLNEPNNERDGFGGFVAQISAQYLFPLNNTSAQSNTPFPNFPYTSYFHWDPSNLSLAQSGGGFAAFANNQADDHRLALPSSSDLYFYPSGAAMPSFNIPNAASFHLSMENNDQLRQMNNQNIPTALPTTLNLISSPVKSSSFGHLINSKSVYSVQEISDARRLLKETSLEKQNR